MWSLEGLEGEQLVVVVWFICWSVVWSFVLVMFGLVWAD